jgi:hypothetical protein
VTASIPGYTTTLDAGKPELLEKTILIEVPVSVTTVRVHDSSTRIKEYSSHKMAPAPRWTLSEGGQLVPEWFVDESAYSMTVRTPDKNFEVAPEVTLIGGKHYLRLVARPLSFNPSTNLLLKTDRITIDVAFSDEAWGVAAPANGEIPPSAVSNVLRMQYAASGLYEITYDDLVNNAVDGPFTGKDTSQFRLYHRGKEISLYLNSKSFSPGFIARFYAPYVQDELREDLFDEVVLSPVSLTLDDGEEPLRMKTVDAAPGDGLLSAQVFTEAKATYEQDLLVVYREPLGRTHDRLFWKKIFNLNGGELAQAWFDLDVDLGDNVVDSDGDYSIKAWVKGSKASIAFNPTHNLGLYVNNKDVLLAQESFDNQDINLVEFIVPASAFLKGTNRISLKAMATNVPNDDYDLIYVDRLEINYLHELGALDDKLEVSGLYQNRVLVVGGFSVGSGVDIYNVTNDEDVRILTGAKINEVDTDDFEVSFFVPEIDGEANDPYHRDKFILLSEDKYLKPSQLFLDDGSETFLRDITDGADLIIVGPTDLLEEIDSLVEQRRLEGLRVVVAPLERIYAEFSNGLVSSQAIRDFVQYASYNWTAPAPKYLLLVGDGTEDSKGTYKASVNAMPAPMVAGLFGDLPSDNWFVEESENSIRPLMAVGRIPASTRQQVKDYIAKLFSYEQTMSAPSFRTIKNLSFIADADTLNEGFATKAATIRDSAIALDGQLDGTLIVRQKVKSVDTDAVFRDQILAEFNVGPLAMLYMGHGAENAWAGANIFTNEEVKALTNTKYPVVLAMNCLNSAFHHADQSFTTIGEEMIFNPRGGAIGFLGSTTFAGPNAELPLAISFMTELAKEVSGPAHTLRIGDLLLKSKLTVGTSSFVEDTIRGYTYFGDPSMTLPRHAFHGENEVNWMESVTPTSSPDLTNASSASDGGGGGCSAFGATSDTKRSRTDGLLEIAFLAMIFIGLKKVSRRKGKKL